MCPDKLASQYSQHGFLLPLALFILIAMGALALVISRTATQTHHGITQELLSLESFYAAESGAQRGLNRLFFDSNNFDLNKKLDMGKVNDACLGMNININFSGIQGLQLCTAQVNCTCLSKDGSSCSANDPTSYYNITSVGRCGQGEYLAERTIEAGAHLDQGGP